MSQLEILYDEIKIYELPEMLSCNIHELYDPRAFYTERELIEMLDEQGHIDCPMCMAEIVGYTE